ncbi:LruC domain-containing protein [Bacteroides luti]|uniref:LruC domain-containing protein n=2 Tax=Bacteroides luti TaxID=1297750 RepID=A0A1M5BDS9_9BACE|nr:LruC domain-containing protein [Bacteroides luti]
MALAAITSAFLLTGCQKDLYDPNYDGNAIISGIPDSFNWSTISSVNLTVNVNDQYNGEYYYTVEVYDNNPLFNTNAKLLTKGVAKKGEAYASAFSIPQNLTTLYIQQTSPTGNREVKMLTITSGSLTCDFSTAVSVKSSSATTRSIATKAETFIYTTYTEPAKATVIGSTNHIIATGGTYIVDKDYTGDITFPGEGNATLYIKGTWTNTASSFTLQGGMNIIVLNGGEIATNTDLSITGSSNPSIVVMPGGKFNDPNNKNIAINFDTNGTIINQGTFNIQKLTLPSSASLHNNGTMSMDELIINSANTVVNDNILTAGKMDLTNGTITNNSEMIINGDVTTNGTNINNSGSFTATNMSLGGGIITNNCKIVISNKLSTSMQKPTLNMGSGSWLQAKELNVGSLEANMNSASIFYISDIATFSNNTSFNGTGDAYALLKMKSVVISGNWDLLSYNGKLKVEADNHDSHYTLNSGATISKLNEAEITIPSTPCTDGNTPGGKTPSNPTFPIVINTNSYYTYTMEDQWPYYGDYDMNDIVVTITPQYKTDNKGYVEEMTIIAKLKAIGATKSLGAAFQLDKVAANNVTNVIYSPTSTDKSVFEVTGTNVEKDQALAVIPLFDNAHSFLGSSGITNTSTGSQSIPVKTVEVTITFNKKTVIKDNLDVKYLNFFIVTDKQKTNRTEIHLAGYNPTDKVNASLFGTGNDSSSSTTKYISKSNLVWGMVIPDDFSYPVENTSILTAYPDFKPWAVSGGTTNTDWYNSSKADSQYIYK